MTREAVQAGDQPAHEIPQEVLARVIEVLTTCATPARRARLETALQSRTRDVAVVIEDIANEHNAAAVLRSAEAFGFFEVHIIEAQAELRVSRNVARGAHKWLDLKRHTSTPDVYRSLKARGYQVWASVLRGDSISVSEIPVDRKVALVFGNEHRGLSDTAIESADGRFMVPMTGLVESLNISVAAATSCYDLMYRRGVAGQKTGLDEHDHRAVLSAWLARSVKSSRSVLERESLPYPVLLDAPIPLVE